MPFSSYADLRSSIRDWAERSSLSDALVKDFVVLAESVFNYGDGENGVRPLRTRDMETTATVTMTDGVGNLPSGFLEAIKVTDPGDVTRDIKYATPDWIDENFPTGQDGTSPAFYTIIGTSLYCPIDVSLTYYEAVETITVGDGGVNWLLTKAPNAYLWGGLASYSIYNKNPDAAVGYRSMMVNALAALTNSELNSRAGHMQRRAAMPAY